MPTRYVFPALNSDWKGGHYLIWREYMRSARRFMATDQAFVKDKHNERWTPDLFRGDLHIELFNSYLLGPRAHGSSRSGDAGEQSSEPSRRGFLS